MIHTLLLVEVTAASEALRALTLGGCSPACWTNPISSLHFSSGAFLPLSSFQGSPLRTETESQGQTEHGTVRGRNQPSEADLLCTQAVHKAAPGSLLPSLPAAYLPRHPNIRIPINVGRAGMASEQGVNEKGRIPHSYFLFVGVKTSLEMKCQAPCISSPPVI